MLASTLIRRSLRLINEPGRAATLSPTDETDAFETLQEILNSEATSKLFVPGIRRHFFPTVASQDIYSYGIGPGTDFDTRLFEDPPPIKVEDVYIRVGSTIVSNELVSNDRFDDTSAWTAGTGWTLVNGEASATAATGTLSQALTGLTIGVLYRLKVEADVFAGDVTLTVDTVSQVIASTGSYEFTFVATTATPTITFTPNATDDFTGAIDDVSLRDASKLERTELTGTGSDYDIRLIDQSTYNRRFSKGTGGRPYQMLFSRAFPHVELRFDNAPSGPSDILVMDVLVNSVSVEKLTSQITIHEDGIKWLRYQLAKEMAPEYGKELSVQAERVLRTSKNKLFAGAHRIRYLRVDTALRNRQAFNINRGDP